MIEDIFSSPAAEVLTANLIRELADYEEFESLSVDATMRVTMTIMGQSHIRDRQTGDAFHRQDCMRRLITMIGRAGAVIAMQPTERENTESYKDVLSACIPSSALRHVRFIATDDPSPVMWRELSQLLPSLEVMSRLYTPSDSVRVQHLEPTNHWVQYIAMHFVQIYSLRP
jgi:hypothetical protein